MRSTFPHSRFSWLDRLLSPSLQPCLDLAIAGCRQIFDILRGVVRERTHALVGGEGVDGEEAGAGAGAARRRDRQVMWEGDGDGADAAVGEVLEGMAGGDEEVLDG